MATDSMVAKAIATAVLRFYDILWASGSHLDASRLKAWYDVGRTYCTIAVSLDRPDTQYAIRNEQTHSRRFVYH